MKCSRNNFVFWFWTKVQFCSFPYILFVVTGFCLLFCLSDWWRNCIYFCRNNSNLSSLSAISPFSLLYSILLLIANKFLFFFVFDDNLKSSDIYEIFENFDVERSMRPNWLVDDIFSPVPF
jgi:hypothetical protein